MPERPERPALAVFSTKPYDRTFLDAANANLAAGGGGPCSSRGTWSRR